MQQAAHADLHREAVELVRLEGIGPGLELRGDRGSDGRLERQLPAQCAALREHLQERRERLARRPGQVIEHGQLGLEQGPGDDLPGQPLANAVLPAQQPLVAEQVGLARVAVEADGGRARARRSGERIGEPRLATAGGTLQIGVLARQQGQQQAGLGLILPAQRAIELRAQRGQPVQRWGRSAQASARKREVSAESSSESAWSGWISLARLNSSLFGLFDCSGSAHAAVDRDTPRRTAPCRGSRRTPCTAQD